MANADGMYVTEKYIIIRDILAESITPTQRNAWLQTITGSLFLIWQTLKKYQPDLTLAKVHEIVTDEIRIDIISILNGLDAEESDSKNAERAEATAKS
jgi:hypothetical protein